MQPRISAAVRKLVWEKSGVFAAKLRAVPEWEMRPATIGSSR